MNYNQIKKLDEKTLEKLTDGLGPSDECLCSLLAPPVDRRGFRASLKKVFTRAKRAGRREVDVHMTPCPGGKGIYTTKEVMKRDSVCGKCGCDHDKVVLKHSIANIRITSPDVSSLCPCPSDCLPDKEKLLNNVKVTIEHLEVHPETLPTASLQDLDTQNISQTSELSSVHDSIDTHNFSIDNQSIENNIN